MASLILTPDNGNSEDSVVKSNSFLTVEEADTYFETRLYSDKWPDPFPTDSEGDPLADDNATVTAQQFADRENKEIALISSSRFLSSYFQYVGTRTWQYQILAFPRIGLYDYDGWWLDYYTIPEKVKEAAAEFAIYQLESEVGPSGATSPLDSGLTEIKVSSIALKFSRDALNDKDSTDLEFPQYIQTLLHDFIEGVATGGSSGTLPVQRT